MNGVNKGDQIDKFVEGLNMEKYGVVRIDWIINNEIRGLQENYPWDNHRNWEIESYTSSGIVLEQLPERDESPIASLARYCLNNNISGRDYYFPIDDPSVNKPKPFTERLKKLDLDNTEDRSGNNGSKEKESTNNNSTPNEDENDEAKFIRLQGAYVKNLQNASKKHFENTSTPPIQSVVITPIITKSIISSTNILAAYIIITSTWSKEALCHNEEFRFDVQALKYACMSEVNTELSKRFFEKIGKESIRAAKAAIMSRNMSHNLGSHVMAYLKQDLADVQDILRSEVLRNLEFNSGDHQNLELPFLVGLGRFISYLQERQDFIATVCTDYIPYSSPVNFKDSIYDELNPDYRSMRHPDRKGVLPQNILLKNIVRSEGLSRDYYDKDGNSLKFFESKISIKFRDFDGQNKSDDLERMRKINLSLPGGVMGRQAFFSIMENVIRNAAKHGKWQKKGRLDITIDFYEKSGNGFNQAGVIGDDANRDKDEKLLDFLDNNYGTAVDIDGLYIVSITDNTDTDDDTINKISDALKESFIKEGSVLNGTNKGIKEMRISAAWLRGIGLDEQKRAPLLRVRKSKDNNVQYLLCMPKLRKVALIFENSTKLKEQYEKCSNFQEQLNLHDWKAFTLPEFKQSFDKGFEFIVLCEGLDRYNSEIRDFCHSRTYNNDVFKLGKTDYSDSDFNDAEKLLYEKLAGNDINLNIAIFDGDDNKIKKREVSDDIKGKILPLSTTVEFSSNNDYPFRYRKHHDSKDRFETYMARTEQGKNIRFVESITGGNSTDRLVRNDALDYRWFYSHIHAMITEVAIFDERLFSKIMKIDESKLLPKRTDWEKRWESFGDDVKTMKEDLSNYDSNNKNCQKNDESIFQLNDKNSLLAKANEWYPSTNDEELQSADYLPITFFQKGVSVFTIVDNEDGSLSIWGKRGINYNSSVNDNGGITISDYRCILGKIATIQREGDDINITFINDYDMPKFDYISIHQGLLDKIYRTLNIKVSKDSTEEEMNTLKLKVTKSLYDKFARLTINDRNDSLPGLLIHSGRSKPEKDDMPQHQPFLQYAAIEHAVMDCKYELVQLLDFAKF